MNQDLGLKILSEIMAWNDDRAREEFRWLRLMARLKYDGYRDFQAGMRFIESLATWLQRSRRGGGWNWVGVVSGLFNPNDSGVGALERRPRHDEGYHEGGGCGRRSFAFG